MPFDPTLPLERAHTIPNDWYTDPKTYDMERDRIFARSWLCVGRADIVREPGQFFTTTVAGEPLAIVRGDDGVLRGFFNVCRHRAAPVLMEPCGRATKLRCQYHGWTYDLAGQLRGTPEFTGVCEFDKSDHGLKPLGAIDTWGPFIWVSFEPPTVSLPEYLGPVPTWWAGRPFDLQYHSRVDYDIACNWKVYVDNYLDGGYHVATIHPALADVLDNANYTTVADGMTVLQSSPMKPSSGDAGRTRTGSDAAYWWVFPNVMINRYSGIMDVNTVLPLGPDRCRVVFDYWFAPGTDAAFIRDSIAVADQVQREDIAICERVQANLASRSYTTGRFSVSRENGGYHFHRLVGKMLAEGDSNS
jgi:choline monooxygenase